MRSLGTIRARVERLASAGLPGRGAADRPLGASVRAVPGLRRRPGGPRRGAGPGGGPRRSRAGRAQGFFWADELTTCPRCDAPLPS